MQDIDSLPDTALPGWLDVAELRSWPGWVDLAWVVLWVLGLACIVVFGRWEAVPFHLIWIAFALLYSFRVRTTGGTVWVLAAMAVTTFAAIAVDVLRGNQPADELTAAPLMAAMFWVMGWHGRRRQTAEPVQLTDFAMDLLWRWRPAADRRWELGRLDDFTVSADRERLGLAADAFLENAVRHTDRDGTISLSVVSTDRPDQAGLVVEDTGAGISPTELKHIFERFTTGSHPIGRRGTGLGLALVQAVAAGHGGTVAAYSALGQGSRFELTLPLAAPAAADQPRPETCRSVR